MSSGVCFNFKLGVLWSSKVTITNIKVSLTKGACHSALRPAILGDILQDTSSPMVPTAWRASNQRGPKPSRSCLFVYLTSHMCVSVVVFCAFGLPFFLVCVCPTGLVLADSSSCSPLLLSKPFVSVRCFCFDAFFLPLHLNFHPAQSGRRFRFSIGARIFPKPISIIILTAAHCFFSSFTLD